MDFEDSDWTLAAEQPPPATGPRVALGSLLAGVALGAIAASGLWWAFAGPRAAAPVAAVRAEASPAAALAASAASAPLVADTAAATPATSTAVRGDDERKALAWSRYYQRPASCEGNPSTEQLVECANHFIRTKRLFDAEWAAGRL